MKKSVPLFFTIAMLISCAEKSDKKNENALKYPSTKKGNVVDTYFGTEVKDPYRWLENDRSEETETWVKAQNKVTFDYLNAIPYRDKLEERLTEIWNYERLRAPHEEGGYIYFAKNDGLQDQYMIYRKKNESAPPEIFLDPNKFSKDGSTSLDEMSFSEDGKTLAYSISIGGSDWRKVIVMNAETREIKEDTLQNIKFSAISWKGNGGFYYSSYDKPDGSKLSAKTDQHKLYYHKLGTAQSEDELIFGGNDAEKNRYVRGEVTEDNRYLVVWASNTTSGNKLFLKDLKKKESELIPVVDSYETSSYVIDNAGSKLYIVTNRNAPNRKIVMVDATNPTPENWVDLIPETENVLIPAIAGGYIFAEYMVDAVSKVKQYNYEGKLVREIELPGIGSAAGFNGKKKDSVLYYNFTNYVTPNSIYKYNIKKGTTELYFTPKIDFNPGDYVSKQIFYRSKDGTKIPMIINYKKGLERNGKNPTILYGYGGFNISLTPSFSTASVAWLEQGGIYAVPNIRGGGEYGRAWHDAGTKMKKQNVFDDFIAAAEYLIKNNYTSNDYLAIKGGSNGGLLVGATMTQRPELVQVALPAVGVLDMLRYHTFTSGAGWAYDYGTSADSKEMFEYLYAYSPVHNVDQGTEYPATLITTGDHDDRVVPAHSFKFAAELQSKQAANDPVLIRIETNAGHGAGTPVSKIIEQQADQFAFTFYNMGFEKLPME